MQAPGLPAANFCMPLETVWSFFLPLGDILHNAKLVLGVQWLVLFGQEVLVQVATFTRCTLPSGSWLGSREHFALLKEQRIVSSRRSDPLRPLHLRQSPRHLHATRSAPILPQPFLHHTHRLPAPSSELLAASGTSRNIPRQLHFKAGFGMVTGGGGRAGASSEEDSCLSGNGKVYVEELFLKMMLTTGKITASSSASTSLLRILPALHTKNDLFHLCFRLESNYVADQLQCAVFKQ